MQGRLFGIQDTRSLAFTITCLFFPILAQGAQNGIKAQCEEALKSLPGKIAVDINSICGTSQQLTACQSEKGTPIFHFDRHSASGNTRRVLVLALVHGDEPESAVVAKLWMERLLKIEPRSSWRIVPVLNPDGYEVNSRLNSRGVDINRNFPTKDWHDLALKNWEKVAKKDPRRYPGAGPASERETVCAIQHIEDFKPDFVVAIHTPYGVLDFDGPNDLRFPKAFLPWVSLGHFPGSLGRYMWHEQSIPVLTIELKGQVSLKSLDALDTLQDVSGYLALQTKPRSTPKGH